MKLRNGITAVRTWLARASTYLPIRLPGLVLGLAAGGVIWYARRHADYLLFPAGVAALGLLGLCLVCSCLGAFFLRESIKRHGVGSGLPDELETTHRTHTTFRFKRLVAWPMVEPRMRWERPAGVRVELEPDGAWLREVITADERGRHARVVRRFTVEDIFGLTQMTFLRTWVHPIRVVPARATAGVELAIAHASGDAYSHPEGRPEGDLVEMRRYGPGDPMRHILWKTFARTRRLLVRMPERSVSPLPTTCAYFIAAPGDEATAATARLYVETGLLGGDFLFAADGATAVTPEPEEAVEQIIDSIRLRGDGGGGLDAFRRQVDPIRLGRCVIFAPPVDGAWCQRVAGFARGLPSPATVIIGVEGDIAEPPRKVVRRLLFAPVPDTAAAVPPRWRHDLVKVRATLEAAGASVKILHRGTGQLL